MDATTDNDLLSFMDTFSGYNEIPMLRSDVAKTTFITVEGMFCYKVMLFMLGTKHVYKS